MRNAEMAIAQGKISAKQAKRSTAEPLPVRAILIAISLAFIGIVLVLPLISVFLEALRHGIDGFVGAVIEKDALSSIRLTLLVSAIAVPLNIVFGLCAAWAITKFDFRGRSILMTLIDLPF